MIQGLLFIHQFSIINQFIITNLLGKFILEQVKSEETRFIRGDSVNAT